MNVSVVIPAHNAERFITEAIDSVFQQQGCVLEQVIVVDNNSTDATMATVESAYGSAVIRASESRPGAAFARNTGLKLVTGDAIAFLDADDVWLPCKLRRQCAELEANPELSLVFCHGEEFARSGLSLPVRTEPHAFLAASGLLARRSAFDLSGPFPEVATGEFIAWFGWTQTLGLQTVTLPEVLVRRRIHETNTTRDRRGLAAGYAEAMHWLLKQRRGLATEAER